MVRSRARASPLRNVGGTGEEPLTHDRTSEYRRGEGEESRFRNKKLSPVWWTKMERSGTEYDSKGLS